MYKKSFLYVFFFLLIGSIHVACQTKKQKLVGGGCEGCEALLEFGNQKLTSTDTLPLFEENSPKLKLTGTVFKKDGKTPAPGVIIYIHHTGRSGLYENLNNEKGWGKRHGSFRGWVKTGADGRYVFYTFRPKAYPDRSEPEHIHITVKEPNTNSYYLDDFVFDDDPLLTLQKRKQLPKRGGSGISKPLLKNGILTIERNLILGLNIPDYD